MVECEGDGAAARAGTLYLVPGLLKELKEREFPADNRSEFILFRRSLDVGRDDDRLE